MSEELIIEILKDAFYTSFIILLPILGASLIIGILISIFQAATSLQEMTLTFVPKLIVTVLVIIFLLPWIAEKMMSLTYKMFTMFLNVI
ncbi:flagellar biosynthetic protein FliQ [Melioribacter sp. OK-6-Me]|uniref:flagellar biosynthetic protein FliQ n=1 Tax=unclassified Melioribacter TaxID=2627329 RepID=UPI003EDAEAE9